MRAHKELLEFLHAVVSDRVGNEIAASHLTRVKWISNKRLALTSPKFGLMRASFAYGKARAREKGTQFVPTSNALDFVRFRKQHGRGSFFFFAKSKGSARVDKYDWKE